jgi:lysophospholipase
MSDLSSASTEFLPDPLPHSSSLFDYFIAKRALCDDAPRRSPRAPFIRSFHLEEPSRVLHPGPGIHIDVDFIETPDGLHLRCAAFRPIDKPARDTYVFRMGKSAPIEAGQSQIEHIVRQGHQVLTMDMRSQGLSSRTVPNLQKVHVNDFSEYGADLQLFMENYVAPRRAGRLFVVAYSTGSAVTISAIANGQERQEDIDHYFLMVPLMKAKKLTRGRQVVAQAARVAPKLGMGENYCIRCNDRDVQKDRKRYQNYTLDLNEFENAMTWNEIEPRLNSGGATWSWVASYGRYAQSLKTMPDNLITVPCDIVLAGMDRVVVNRHTHYHSQRLIPDARKHILPAAHALELGGPKIIQTVGSIIALAAARKTFVAMAPRRPEARQRHDFRLAA